MNKLLALSLLATATASGSAAVPALSSARTPASHKLPSSLAIESATHVAPTSATSRSKGLTVSAARRVALRFENSVDGGVELDSDYEILPRKVERGNLPATDQDGGRLLNFIHFRHRWRGRLRPRRRPKPQLCEMQQRSTSSETRPSGQRQTLRQRSVPRPVVDAQSQ